MLRMNRGNKDFFSLPPSSQFSVLIDFILLAGRFDIMDTAISLISTANPNGPIGVKVTTTTRVIRKHAL